LCDVPVDADPDAEQDAVSPSLPSSAEVVAALEIDLESCDSDHIEVLQMANFLNIAKADQLASRKRKK